MRRAEAFGHRLHVGDRSRRRAQTETAVSGGEDGGVVITTHQGVGDEGRVECHDDDLYQEDDGDRQGERSQLPQFEVEQRHRQEERERGVAEDVNGAVKHVETEDVGQHVAQDDAKGQRPDEFRQVEDGKYGFEIDFVDAVHDFRECQAGGKHRQGVDGGAGGNQPFALRFFEHVVGVFAGVGAAVIEGFQRLALHFVDEAARNRATDKATSDETEGGAGDAEVGRVGEADFFEVRPPAGSGAVATGHGDGAGDEAEQRVLVERDRQSHADGVLDGDEDADDDGEDNQRKAACFQAGEVGAQTDGGEEHQHEGFAQGFVEGETDVVKEVERVDDDRGDQAAGDRLGNVEVLQEAVFPH